ncbi:DUF3040 domain-containing protein [Streptomyces sp. YGL11-2]|uniref:DUF3040 domain-containing protein n=1 Tax=Streptomyces sp. YGL11-2 TaxID=3414028 RepID=UPI003CE75EB2
MTLPMHDRQVLAEIEQGFMAEDPDLALLLGTVREQPSPHATVPLQEKGPCRCAGGG